jgi:hypothetical protein
MDNPKYDLAANTEFIVRPKREREKRHFMCCFTKFQYKRMNKFIEIILFLFTYEFWFLSKVGLDLKLLFADLTSKNNIYTYYTLT